MSTLTCMSVLRRRWYLFRILWYVVLSVYHDEGKGTSGGNSGFLPDCAYMSPFVVDRSNTDQNHL